MRVVLLSLACLCLLAVGLAPVRSAAVTTKQEKAVKQTGLVAEQSAENSQDNPERPQIKSASVRVDFTEPDSSEGAASFTRDGALQRSEGLVVAEYQSSGSIISKKISVPIDAPEPFLAVRALWSAKNAENDHVKISLRASVDGRSWGDWLEVGTDYDSASKSGEHAGSSLYFAKETKYVQYRFSLRRDALGVSPVVTDLQLVFISPGTTQEHTTVSSTRQEQFKGEIQLQALGSSTISKPAVISRKDWGCPTGQSSPGWSPKYTNVTHLIVHHSVTSTNLVFRDWPAVVREIWAEHAIVNRWFDIGYNYLIDPNGKIYEGRAGGDNVEGAHFSNANANTMGVVMLGNYTNSMPTAAAMSSLKQLLAWKASQNGIDPEGSAYHPSSQLTLKNISGHRDANASPVEAVKTPGTDCPGDALYRLLPTVRHDVRNMVSGVCGGVSVPSDQWTGAYYNNRNLSGAPAMISNDGTWFLDFDWGNGNPGGACGIGSDNFSVVWTRTLNLNAGVYRFTVTGDDGVRLYVDGRLYLDKWQDQAPTTYTVDVPVSAGQHGVRFAYYENGGGALAKLYWERIPPTISGYSWNSTPRASQPFGGTIMGTGFISGSTQVFFCLTGTNTCYQQPAAGISVNSSTSLSVSNVNLSSGSWQIYVQTPAGPSARSAAFSVQSVVPTITGYSWNTTPTANQPFGGLITGTGFVSGGTQVFFCVNGTSTCYQHPAAGVTVNNSTSLSVSNVNLGSGSWQIYVKTSAGQSVPSTAFTVQAPAAPRPTITGYSWNTTPRANQPFSGTITGTYFISGGTQVFFCVNGTSTCYQHPSAGVTVNSSTSLSVNNVNLSSGSWQVYVQTAAGQSARSASFTVQAAAPTISGYSWSSTPTGTQPFSGTITGTGFLAGDTQVWFCVNGTGTCYQQPSAGVGVNSLTSLGVSNVRLSTGLWQIYVQTSAGQSARSAAFTVR
jgi:hypothetical protein